MILKEVVIVAKFIIIIISFYCFNEVFNIFKSQITTFIHV